VKLVYVAGFQIMIVWLDHTPMLVVWSCG